MDTDCNNSNECFSKLMAILQSPSSDSLKLKQVKADLQLLDWIFRKTAKLDNNAYDISVRIVWIKNGYTDFPLCETCSKPLENKLKLSMKMGYYGASGHMYCCHKCAVQNIAAKAKRKKTCLQKYGVEHVTQSKEVQQKIVDTCMQRYGIKNGGGSKQAQEKIRKTLIDHYGVDVPCKSPAIRERSRQSMFKKYGAYNNMQSAKGLAEYLDAMVKKYGDGIKTNMQLKSFQEKSCKTKLERYGNSHFTNKEKAKATCLDRYGDPYYNNHEKYKQTMTLRYGHPYSMQSSEIKQKAGLRYRYDGMAFDSAPEIALYIYCKDHGIDVVYLPLTDITYVVDGIVHQYMPDFKVDRKLVEIKGDLFIAEDGTWQNPYDHSQDYRYELKRQCAIANGILILTSKDYTMYLEYVSKTYGNSYIAQFKRK